MTDGVWPCISVWPSLSMPIDLQGITFIIFKGGRVFFATWEKCIPLITIELACSDRKVRCVAVSKLKLDIWKTGLQRISLCPKDCTLSQICEHIAVLLDLSPQIANRSL